MLLCLFICVSTQADHDVVFLASEVAKDTQTTWMLMADIKAYFTVVDVETLDIGVAWRSTTNAEHQAKLVIVPYQDVERRHPSTDNLTPEEKATTNSVTVASKLCPVLFYGGTSISNAMYRLGYELIPSP